MGVLLSEAFECQFCHPSAPLDSGLRRNDEWGAGLTKGCREWRRDAANGEGMPRMANERLPEGSIPDRSPGHAFVAIAHAGWCRHAEV